VPVDDVRRFEGDFLDYLQRSHDGVYASIRETGQLTDDTATTLKDAIEEFRRSFEIGGGEMLVSGDGEDQVEATDEEDIDRETVTRRPPPPPPAQA
jgi:F-type H+-transporting ATPase subunit alpha